MSKFPDSEVMESIIFTETKKEGLNMYLVPSLSSIFSEQVDNLIDFWFKCEENLAIAVTFGQSGSFSLQTK